MKGNSPTPLPQVEWDFSNLDKAEVLLAFYWEYGRTSEAIKAEVKKMRDSRPKPNVWLYCPHGHPHFETMFWLAERRAFPETPWLTLKQNAIEEVREQRRAIQLRIEQLQSGTLKPDRRSIFSPGFKFKGKMPVVLPDAPVPRIEWMLKAFGPHITNLRQTIGYRHLWHGDEVAVRSWCDRLSDTFVLPPNSVIKPIPEASTFEIGVHWHLSDGEILDNIKYMLEVHRPNQFKEYAKRKSPLQRGYRDSFPFTMSAALHWLGVFRRREELSSWTQFFHLYPAQTNTPRKKYSDWYSEQARTKEVRFAKHILDWFNKNKPLEKRAFR